jgi:hypothetical protein
VSSSSDDSPVEVYVERTTVKVSTVRGVEKDDGSFGLSSLVLEYVPPTLPLTLSDDIYEQGSYFTNVSNRNTQG